jgi:hypothetical protein
VRARSLAGQMLSDRIEAARGAVGVGLATDECPTAGLIDGPADAGAACAPSAHGEGLGVAAIGKIVSKHIAADGGQALRRRQFGWWRQRHNRCGRKTKFFEERFDLTQPGLRGGPGDEIVAVRAERRQQF